MLFCRFYCRFYFRFWLPLLLPFCTVICGMLKRNRRCETVRVVGFGRLPLTIHGTMLTPEWLSQKSFLVPHFTPLGAVNLSGRVRERGKCSCSLTAADWPLKTAALFFHCFINGTGPPAHSASTPHARRRALALPSVIPNCLIWRSVL